MLPSSRLKEVTITDYLLILKRKLWLILACVIVSGAWSTLQAFKKVPLYQTAAKIFIEKQTPNIAPMQQVYPTSGMMDRDYLQSQMNILASRMLAKKTVERLIASGDPTFVGYKEPENTFLSGVQVNIIPGTQLINIGYIHTDPVKAAKFANALADTFIKDDVEKRKEVSRSAAGWLENQLAEIKKKLRESEDALNAYMLKNLIVSIPDIERRSQGGLEGLKQQAVNIKNELMELSKRYKAKHPKVLTLKVRLEAVSKSIEDETQKLLALNEKMVQYNALKQEVESNRSLRDSLLRRMKETEISMELEATNMRIIDLATVPQAPFSPNRGREIRNGIFIGLLLGVGVSFLLEYFDSTVKTANDIEIYVKLPFLGYALFVKSPGKAKNDMKYVDSICNNLPTSRIAEAFRSIRTSIIFSSPEDRPLKTILVTSTSPREGKTTVSTNLGIIFANANEKTILVEADMRRNRMAQSLGLENEDGLSSYLAGTASLDQVIQKTSVPNFSVIVSGPRPPNPTELLTSAKTKDLLAGLKSRFDRVILDSPPVLTVADAVILANVVDGVIEVIQAGFLNIDIILKGRQRLFEAKAKVIGVILNKVNVKSEDAYYYYHYYYTEDTVKKV